MADTTFTDETLMAYADGALDEATARQVADEARADDAVAARIALFRGTAEVLARAADEERAAPAPDVLTARIQGMLAEARPEATEEIIVPFRDQRDDRVRRAALWPAALAASLALAVGLGAGWRLASSSQGTTSTIDTAWTVPKRLGDPLSRLRSGESFVGNGGEVTVIASFRDGAGALCREFEVAQGAQAYVSVACREADAWTIRFAAATDGGTEGYATASSLEALDAYLVGIDAGAPLDASAEADALGGQER